jgi:hypothetical protein
MSESLAARFARDKGAPQEVGDDIAHAIYKRQVRPGMKVVISLAPGKTDPVQGLCMKVQGGKLKVEESVASDIVLWTDSAPPTVIAEVLQTKGESGELRVWNCWRGRHGSTDAWLGDAGMVVVEDGEVVELQCSDGRPLFTKTDLVVRLRFEDEKY